MPVLSWDDASKRTYEAGLDRGVLYLPDGSAVPWNGLVSIVEGVDASLSSVYYDGIKINELATLGDFYATMTAVTFPDEFMEFDGGYVIRNGAFTDTQKPKLFALCYRTKIGDDFSGTDAGYKIHVVYNVSAIASDKTRASLSNNPGLVGFEWKLTAIPEEVPGISPTAHVVLRSTDLDPWLLEELEELLYGGIEKTPRLIPMQELFEFLRGWFRVKIVYHGDGTWSAIESRPGFINQIGDWFEITNINARFLDVETFVITTTSDISEVNLIDVYDVGDGTWIATTDEEELIDIEEDGFFEIHEANAVADGPYAFQISNTQARR